MDIVIIANFCGELDQPTNNRFRYIADLLAAENEVELVSSTFSHGKKQKRVCDYTRFSYKVTLIEEPGYGRNISIQRFLSHRKWGKNVLAYIQKRNKPDIVYCAIPSLTAAALVGQYCNKNHIPFVIDVQDLWPEAFQMVINIPVFSNIAFAPFKRLANRAYAAADLIIGVSQTYVKRAALMNTRAKKISVFIGTDLRVFDENVRQHKVDRKGDSAHWVAYCGSLSDSYDIPCVINAIRKIGNPNIKLVVMGGGHLEENFKMYAQKAGINATFMGRMNYPEMCGLLAACDIAINPIRGKSSASIINKHADYAAAGKAVINTQESAEYRDLVEKYNMGFNCQNGNAQEISECIEILCNDVELREEMGRNARRCAEEVFDRTHSYQKILSNISKLIE